MIAVIADDLSGAAEIGGIGLRYDLTTEIVTEIRAGVMPDLLIIAADTRSMKEDDAVKKSEAICHELLRLKPDMVYKKIDSVLRGHIVAEVSIQMQVMGFPNALIIPANPALGRTIEKGVYYVNGQPVHLTAFSKDPEFPVSSSNVVDMLRSGHTVIELITIDKPLSEAGIMLGEAKTGDDLKRWASNIPLLTKDGSGVVAQRARNPKTLLAGASGFFSAILNTIYGQPPGKQEPPPFGSPLLFVSGTTFIKSREAIAAISARGGPVRYMPMEMINFSARDDQWPEQWCDELAALLMAEGRAIMAVDKNRTANISAADLREGMAGGVEAVMKRTVVRELVIEGGSSAAAIIRLLGCTRLHPVQELRPGVIRMRVEGTEELHITIKPGSYDWPAVLRIFDHA